MLLLSNSPNRSGHSRVGYPALSFSKLEDIVMREVKRFQDSEHILNNYVSVGDTINGHKIHEIWVSSLGNPMFAVGEEHYNLEWLLENAPAGEKVDG
tara:strand:+ start:1876 stop:2166 length:291 start_codon:yes stop_codon:yes gene_type:complete